MRSARVQLAAAALSSVVLAGCPNTVGPAGDANSPTDAAFSDVALTDTVSTPPAALVCPADAGVAYPASAFACSTRADCTIVVHGLDCCGSLQMVGVNAAHSADFDAPEMACQTAVHFNMCDCVARPTTAQDGRNIPTGAMAIVDCVGGACVTSAP